MKIGWIGTGIMGCSMASHLLKAGHSLQVFNRTASKADPLLALGARFSPLPELAATSDVIITMVGYPQDVEEVLLNRVIPHVRPGSLIIDHTTSSPSLAQTIASATADRNIEVLDAPVSGGDVGAREGKLAIMVGGSEAGFARGLELMRCYGANIELFGGPGAGQHTKITNQIVIAGNMIGMVEGLTYAVKAGLDASKVVQLITSGAAMSFSLKVLGPRVLRGDLEPGFIVEHFVKDLGMALEECRRMKLALPGLALVNQLYVSMLANGEGRKGSQGLIRVLERMNGFTVSPSA
jgi:3-hydroxyisobutyrate dehydrogenase